MHTFNVLLSKDVMLKAGLVQPDITHRHVVYVRLWHTCNHVGLFPSGLNNSHRVEQRTNAYKANHSCLTWKCNVLDLLWCVETKIFRNNKVNIMTMDALSPCLGRSSASMFFYIPNTWVTLFYLERLELPVPSKYHHTIENINMTVSFYMFLSTSAQQHFTYH